MSTESLEKIIEERAWSAAQKELNESYQSLRKLLHGIGVGHSNTVWHQGERALKYCYKEIAPSHIPLAEALDCIISAAIEVRAQRLLPRLRQAVIDNALKESKK